MRGFYLAWDPERIYATLSRKSPNAEPPLQNSPASQIHIAKFATMLRNLNLSDLTLAFPLPWSHYVRLLAVKTAEARSFYGNRGQKIIAENLRQNGLRVEIHDQYFPQNALDEDWLAEVGARGWIVLTKEVNKCVSVGTEISQATVRGPIGARLFPLIPSARTRRCLYSQGCLE